MAKKSVHITLDDELMQAIVARASAAGISRADVIREACRRYLAAITAAPPERWDHVTEAELLAAIESWDPDEWNPDEWKDFWPERQGNQQKEGR